MTRGAKRRSNIRFSRSESAHLVALFLRPDGALLRFEFLKNEDLDVGDALERGVVGQEGVAAGVQGSSDL